MGDLNVSGPGPDWLCPTEKEKEELQAQVETLRNQIEELLRLLKSGQLNPRDPADREEIAKLESAISNEMKGLVGYVNKTGIKGELADWIKNAADDWNVAVAGGPGAPVSDVEALMNDAVSELDRLLK